MINASALAPSSPRSLSAPFLKHRPGHIFPPPPPRAAGQSLGPRPSRLHGLLGPVPLQPSLPWPHTAACITPLPAQGLCPSCTSSSLALATPDLCGFTPSAQLEHCLPRKPSATPPLSAKLAWGCVAFLLGLLDECHPLQEDGACLSRSLLYTQNLAGALAPTG